MVGPSLSAIVAISYLLASDRSTTSTSTPKVKSTASKLLESVRERYVRLNSAPVRLRYTDHVTFSFEGDTSALDLKTAASTAMNSISLHELSDHEEIFRAVSQTHNCSKPIAIYFPGLDGQGISASQQFHDLSEKFELWRMTIDGSDRSSFTELTNTACKFLDELMISNEEKREVLVIGESFGGVLAPSVVMRKQDLVNGLVLVNPATSFDNTQWSTVGPFLTTMQYLNNGNDDDGSNDFPTPYSVLGGLALALTVPDLTQVQQIVGMFTNVTVSSVEEARETLSALNDGFGVLEERLPPSTLLHRLSQWLPVGSMFVNSRLEKLKTPTLVVAGADDNMLPTEKEAERLSSILPNCTSKKIAGSGHFVLDNRVNLTQLILDSPINPFPRKKYDPILDWEVPSPEVVQEAIENQVKIQRTLVSPVFVSTSNDGKRRKGLSAVPGKENRPLLFVANHQFGGLDLGLIISGLLEERNLPVRGLGHPVIFDGIGGGNGSPFAGGAPPNGATRPSLFETFGAVRVTPKNYYRLMQTGQAALLFPGGVREVFHGKNEAYQLMWPEKTDFVRTAAKFNATIIPLSAVGAADSVNILIDAPDMLNLPFGLGDRIANSSSSIMAARYDGDKSSELFAAPFAIPKPLPDRHYFVFGKPIYTNEIDHLNRTSCDAIYEEVKDEMNRGFSDVLKAREKDPYRGSLTRIAYEQALGRPAPTFGMDQV